MRRVVPADPTEPNPRGLRRKPRTIDRIVLKHQQCVEQLARPKPAKPRDLRQPDMSAQNVPATELSNAIDDRSRNRNCGKSA